MTTFYYDNEPLLRSGDNREALGWDGTEWRRLDEGMVILEQATFTVKNGVFEESLIVNDRRGLPEVRCNFSNGLLHGILVKYRRGNIAAIHEYKHGKKEGICCTWYLNGSLCEVYRLSSGLIHGMKINYNMQGEESVRHYVNGVEVFL